MVVSSSVRNFGADRSKVGAAPARGAVGGKKLPTPKGSFGGSSRFTMPGATKANPAATPGTLPAKKASIGGGPELKRTVSDTAKSTS
jgi:hypothetical protein